MGKTVKLTTEDVRVYCDKYGFDVLSEYINAKNTIRLKCRKHDIEFDKKFCDFKKYPICRECKIELMRSRMGRTLNSIIEELKDISPNIKILDKIYIDNRTKMSCKCETCDNVWKVCWSDLQRGRGCPVCAQVARTEKQKTPKEGNSLIELRPQLEKYLKNKSDGYVCKYNEDYIDCICIDCGEPRKMKACDLYQTGFRCKMCGETNSFPNRVMYGLLKELDVEFETEKIFDWKKKYRYDFYIPSMNCIIEVHGKQHYEKVNRRNDRDEIGNDRFKMYRSYQNGIKNYIVVDAQYSNIDYMQKTYTKAMSKYFDMSNVDWNKIFENATKSRVKEAYDLRQSGMSVKKVSEVLGIHDSTARRYIKKFEKILSLQTT